MPASTEHSDVMSPSTDAPAPALAVVDPAGTIVVADAELAGRFGYTREEIVGQPVALLLPDAAVSASATAGAAALSAGGGAPGGELLGRHKDGSRFAAGVSWKQVPTSVGSLLIMSLVDAAPRRHAEEARGGADREHAAFETFIAEQSLQFNNVAGEALPAAIVKGLGTFCEHLGIDRGSFFRIDPQGLLFSSFSWTAPGFVSEHWPLPATEHFPWTLAQLLARQQVAFTSRDSIPDPVDRASFHEMGSRSAVFVPLSVDGRVTGAAGFTMLSAEREWTPDARRRLDVGTALFTQALARLQRDEAIRAALLEVETLKRQLQGPSASRRDGRNGRSEVVGQGVAIRRVLDQIQQVAPTDSTVLLLGETGTGKELFAAQIHDLSSRSAHTMVKVNCAAIPPTLIESELFGREKGAFTGALARQVGRFEMADHSTIFLDEIGDLPAEVQVKLLRVLEERHDRTARQPAAHPRRRPHHRGDASQSRAAGRRRQLPRGPVLPPERVSNPRAAAARTRGGHSGARLAIRGGVVAHARQAGRCHRQGCHHGAAAVPLAGERPRAAQRRRAGHDREHRPASGHPVAAAVPARRRDAARSSPMSRRTTSAPCSRARAGESAAPAARRTGSG